MRKIFLFLTLLICISGYSQVTDRDMVLIQVGEFNMGKNTTNPTDWQPEHKVYVDAFYMDKHEVTNKEYNDFCVKSTK
jgi:formylglycine-generating enzyme required for sulfatase activity